MEWSIQDEPECGKNGPVCPVSPVVAYLVYALLALLVLSLIAMLFFYTIWTAELQITGLQWRISKSELSSLNQKTKGSMVSLCARAHHY